MSTITTYCEICQQSVDHTEIYKHRQSTEHKQNAENEKQSTIVKPEDMHLMSVDSSIPLNLLA